MREARSNEPVEVSGSYDRIISANNDIFRIWFKCWLVKYVPTLMKQQKWFEQSERALKEGDIVLFKGKEKEIECTYKYGKVKELQLGRDGVARSVIVEYQNSEEKVKRNTKRGVRELILILPINEIGIMQELHEAAT